MDLAQKASVARVEGVSGGIRESGLESGGDIGQSLTGKLRRDFRYVNLFDGRPLIAKMLTPSTSNDTTRYRGVYARKRKAPNQ